MSIDRISLSSATPLEFRKPISRVEPSITPNAVGNTDFSNMVANSVKSVSDSIVNASKLSEDYMSGRGKHNLHEVMIAMESSELSFRYMTEVRNKVLDAYNDVMKMQI